MDELATAIEIRGFERLLPNKRKVFVGYLKGKDGIYLRFENNGDVTKLRLSQEAFAAMVELHGMSGEPLRTYSEPVVRHWTVVQQP